MHICHLPKRGETSLLNFQYCYKKLSLLLFTLEKENNFDTMVISAYFLTPEVPSSSLPIEKMKSNSG